eukprot:TRINITY_DN37626_c0_g1_i1.p1 TRINITY_DN37626_c0_g1~~TRINITY_DN37626_c0_g1_i1.p1  ORF type:complete len:255 (+),score=55.54 TRINITY_DN37626_c0_g1_i1:83-766(+)
MSLGSVVISNEVLQDKWYLERYAHVKCSFRLMGEEGTGATAGKRRMKEAKAAVRKMSETLLENVKLFKLEGSPGGVAGMLDTLKKGERVVSDDEIHYVQIEAKAHPNPLKTWYALEHPEKLQTPVVSDTLTQVLKHFPPLLSRTDIASIMKILNEGSPPSSDEVDYVLSILNYDATDPTRVSFTHKQAAPIISIWYTSCAVEIPDGTLGEEDAHCCLQEDNVVCCVL